MLMNVSELLTSIKMDLGIYAMHVPVKDSDLYDVITKRSIKTYSQYFPHIQDIRVNIGELKTYEDTYTRKTVEIPDVYGDRRIIQVVEVDQDIEHLNAGYMTPDMNPSMDLFGGFALGAANAHALSAIMPTFTFEFSPPNRLTLYNYSSYTRSRTIRLGLEHFENLTSIAPSQTESFYSLALVDIKQYLYGILKHYNNLNTAHGNIQLNIDDWADARSERLEIISRWKETSHIDLYEIFLH